MTRLVPCILGLLFVFPSVLSDAAPEGVPYSGDVEDDETFYNDTYAESQNKLQATIFKDYNRNNRPVVDPSSTVDVELHLHVTHVSFNQKEQTMTVHGHMYMSWFDEFLKWDPKDYNGVTTTNVKKWQIWMPDVRVSNSVSGIYSVHDISRNAHITVQTQSMDGTTYKKAKVETYPTFAMKVGCIMDFSDYPYDDHACAVRVFTPKKMMEVQLKVYRSLPPTMFLSWTNDTTTKTTSGEFAIHRASNNISYYRFGENENDAPATGNSMTKTWTIYNMYIFYRRHSATYFVTVALPLASSTTLSLTSLLIKDIQFATILNGITFIIHALFIREFTVVCPVSVYEVPRAMMFHGFSVALTTFVFCFQLFLWSMSSLTEAQQKMIDMYSKGYNLLPVNPFPGFMADFVKELGDIRTRGWNRNVTVWRSETFFLLGFVYLILFGRAFLI